MLKKSITLILVGVVAFVFSGCGTLFHPERRDATPSTEVDPVVLILDCCGLFFGIVPGAVALIIDFSNNTIFFSQYEVLMKRSAVETQEHSEMVAVHIDRMDRESIERAISEQVGRKVTLEELQLARIQ